MGSLRIRWVGAVVSVVVALILLTAWPSSTVGGPHLASPDSTGLAGAGPLANGQTAGNSRAPLEAVVSSVVPHFPCPADRCGPSAGGSPAAGSAFWTNLTNPASPAPPWGYSEAMTFDNQSQSVLLFGANASGGTWGNETWQFSHGQWAQVRPTAGTSPPYQSDMALTYDATDGYVLLFGCENAIASVGTYPNAECNDTWVFSDGAWEEVIGPNPLAKEVQGPGFIPNQLSLAYDPIPSYVLLTNGYDTWSYRAGTWTPLCLVANCSTGFIPGPDLEGVATYDAHDGYVLFDGSVYRSGSLQPGGSWTWKFANGVWTNLSGSSAAPPPRIDSTMAYDSATGSVLLFGGQGFRTFLNDTWSFQGGTWTNVTLGAAPSERTDSQMADDPPDSSVILFSGLSTPVVNADTWAWSATPPIASLSISVTPAIPVPGAPAVFNGSFRGGVGPFAYSWAFGDGGTSTLANPSHIYAADGSYAVNLWLNDSVGYSAHAERTVQAYLPLGITQLQASPNPALLGQLVNFTVTAAGGAPPYSYAWAFGDGQVGGNLSHISHAYTTNGPFEVEATVSDSVGEVVHAFLNISIQLQALAGSSATTGVSPLTVSFVGQAQGGAPPYVYSWSFGDGGTSSLQDPSHTYTSNGEFTVVLTVSDSKGNRSTVSLSVHVGPSSGAVTFGWFDAFVVAAVVAAAVAAVWGGTLLRARARKREGERWIRELSSADQPSSDNPPARPR